MDDFRRYIAEKKGVTDKRIHSITNSFGVLDAFLDFHKTDKNNVTISQYRKIIRRMNQLFGENLMQGLSVTFPYNMGKITVWKNKCKYKRTKTGKIRNTHPIDWNATFKLWYESKEDEQKKTLVRFLDIKNIYTLVYSPGEFCNSRCCIFRMNRQLYKTVRNNIENGISDTFDRAYYERTSN